MRASSASHGKKVSSPYTRYACGTFLPDSLNLLRLFSKRLFKNCHGWRSLRLRFAFVKLLVLTSPIFKRTCEGAGIFCVTSKKTILDVQKARLHPPRMAVVLNLESFAVRQNSKMKNIQGCIFFISLESAPPVFKSHFSKWYRTAKMERTQRIFNGV